MTEKMDQQAFEALLDELGSDRSVWPDELRLAAAAFLEASAEARATLKQAELLDEHFKHLAAHSAPPCLAQRIIAQAEVTEDGWLKFRDWLTSSLWRPAAVVLTPLCLGVLLGLSLPSETSEPDYYLSDYPWVQPEEVSFYE